MYTLRKKCILVLSFGVLLISIVGCDRAVSTPQETVNGTPIAVAKVLGAFYPIEGTQYQLATISADQSDSGSGRDLTDLFSYGRSDYSVYNYAFLDVEAESVHTLLPTNEDVILSIQGYPVPDTSSTAPAEKIPVAWWLYTLAKEDTNEDKQLSYLDQKTLAVSDVGGNGYTELIPGVDTVLGNVLKNETTLLIIYRSGDKNYLARIDLPGRTVAKTTELPSFGENVK